MAQARPRITKELESLPNDKWEYIIDNYIKNEIDRTIAKMYYLDGIPQADIGAEVGYSRSAIKKKLPKLLNIIEKYQKVTKD
jgi:DNA-directed RNA polymerase specialized sigma subunit